MAQHSQASDIFLIPERLVPMDSGRVVNDPFFQHKSGSSTFAYSGLHPEALHVSTLFLL